MARKTARATEGMAHPWSSDARRESSRRARAELEFDEPTVLGALFGQFDSNLVLIENRLGVYIAARGNRIQIEGGEDAVARARDVLKGMHQRIMSGQDIDSGAVESLIAMSNEPTLEGIITGGHDNKTARTVAIGEGEAINAPALAAMFRQIIANNRAGSWRQLKPAT